MPVKTMENESKRLRGAGKQRGSALGEVPPVRCMLGFDP